MSASPFARQATCSQAQSIPSKRVLITDPSQMPDVYSSTPGGTIFGTTPGGTRIIYERAFLLNLKNSPLSKTPPTIPTHLHLMKGEPNISPTSKSPNQKQHHHNQNNHHIFRNNNNNKVSTPLSSSFNKNHIKKSDHHADEHQFDIDI